MRHLPQPDRLRELAAGRSGKRLAGARRGRSHDPGICHVDERERWTDDLFQDQYAGQFLPHRHLAPGLLRRQRSAHRGVPSQTYGSTAPEPAAMHNFIRDWTDRLRQLGRVGVLVGSLQRYIRAVHSPPRARRHRRREPDLLRRAQRLQPLRSALANLRRDLGGLQRLWGQQPVHMHGRLPCREPEGIQGRLRRLLQPPVRRRPHN